MNCKIILLVFLISFLDYPSQNPKIDSLLKKIDNTSVNPSNIDGINQLASEYVNVNPDSTLLLSGQALQLSLKSKYKQGQMFAYKNMATAMSLIGEVDSSLVYFKKAKQISVELKDENNEAACWVGIANNHYLISDLVKYLDYTKTANAIFLKKGNLKGLAATYNSIGDYFGEVAQYDSALFYYQMGHKIKVETKDSVGLISSFSSLAFIHQTKGNYILAANYYIQAMKIAEIKKNKLWIIRTLTNLSGIFYAQENYAKAIDYNLKALQLARTSKNHLLTGGILNNLANIYYDSGNIEESGKYHNEALLIGRKNNNMQCVCDALLGIARIEIAHNSYKNALMYLSEALSIIQKQGDLSLYAYASGLIGNCYYKLNNFREAYKYYRSAKDTAASINNITDLAQASKGLSKVYAGLNDFKSAYHEHVFYTELNDSVLNAENFKQINELQELFEKEKKEKEITEKEKELFKKNTELAIQTAISSKQAAQRNYLIIGLFAAIVLILITYQSFRNKQKANIVITKQKEEVEHQKEVIEKQKHLVEEQQREVLDSISYAKRLQEAILPPQELVTKYLPQNFILYKPKDIVAGDFYWFEHINEVSYFAAADSTGHGVPGALVSVVCSNALNRAVNEFGLRVPGEILDKTRELVLETFAKSDKDVKDGMDISLVKITEMPVQKSISGRIVIPKGQTLSDVMETQRKYKIEWAGANNPLWYYKNNAIHEIVAHKQPIGKTEKPTKFPTHTIELNKGDMFYLFTDGYADQFGGQKGKKFKYKQLKELLLENSGATLVQQKEILDLTFNVWKGELEQIDDVSIIGVRV